MIRKLKALAAFIGILAAGVAFFIGLAAIMCLAECAGIPL